MMKEKKEIYIFAPRVMAVAVSYYDENELYDWSAYIDSIDGNNEKFDENRVSDLGSKLSPLIASSIFPQYSIKKWKY